MQFEIVLNSRTYSLDYRWIARPDYISDRLCDRVSDLMYLLERAGNLTDEDYLRNIFFFTDESGGLLVRGGYSASTDKFGRQIYSVEGIACPARDLRQFWYALPALIAWMAQCPLFRDTWVYGMAEEEDLSGLRVDIPELEEEEQPLTEREEIEFQGEPPIASIEWSKEEAENGEPIGRLIVPDAGVDALITFEESSDVSAVQMDPGNTEDFTDPNTVLYGINDSLHGMNAYLDEDYFKAHPYIYIYTPQKTLEYRVFAAYPGGASEILYDYNGYEFSEFCMLIEDIYHYRSMGLITDESIKEGVMEAWQMLTVSTGSRTGAEETVIYASLCGSKNNQ